MIGAAHLLAYDKSLFNNWEDAVFNESLHNIAHISNVTHDSISDMSAACINTAESLGKSYTCVLEMHSGEFHVVNNKFLNSLLVT